MLLSHILVLGYGWFFVDALMVMLLDVIYLFLTRSAIPLGRIRKSGDGRCRTCAQKIMERQPEAEPQDPIGHSLALLVIGVRREGVRCGKANALISLGTSTVGGLRCFAL